MWQLIDVFHIFLPTQGLLVDLPDNVGPIQILSALAEPVAVARLGYCPVLMSVVCPCRLMGPSSIYTGLVQCQVCSAKAMEDKS